MPIYISPHFTLEEATFSETAVRRNAKNQPGTIEWENMKKAAAELEKIRALTGPLIVNSWYRSYEVNKLVGGSKNSSHMEGWAIDVRSKTKTPLELCRIALESGVKFDQLILEYDRWMHISFDPALRGQVLSIFDNGRYLQGLIKR